MPELVIHAIDCKVVSAGVDSDAIQALSNTVQNAAAVGGVASAAFGGPTGVAVAAALQAAKALISGVPGLVSALDVASDSPDQLYLSFSNQERIAKIWPPGDYIEINGGQIVRPNLRVPFTDFVDVNFWEFDTGSDDDFLGRLTADISHAGGVRFQVVARPSEGNVYLVAYSIETGPIPPTGFSPPTGPTAQGDDMQPGEVLNPNQSITSSNGQFTFVYQVDGNLVLYRNTDGQPRWSSSTDGRPTGVCIMQTDGNLVIYAPNINPIWSSDTSQHPGSRLIVQNDGNVVIYSPDGTAVWATNTVQSN
jgi:hypothetical protein